MLADCPPTIFLKLSGSLQLWQSYTISYGIFKMNTCSKKISYQSFDAAGREPASINQVR